MDPTSGIEAYYDEWVLPAQRLQGYANKNGDPVKWRDGGDSANRVGLIHFAHGLQDKKHPLFKAHFEAIEFGSSGQYVRHPNPESWTSDLDRFSRDQKVPLILALGMYRTERARLWRMFMFDLKRCFVQTNTIRNGIWKYRKDHAAKAPHWKEYNYDWKLPDILWPHHIGCYVRSFGKSYLYPLLWVCDLFLLIDTFMRVVSSIWNVKHDNDTQLVGMLMQAQVIMCTPWSWLAKYLYRLRRHPVGFESDHPGIACFNSHYSYDRHAPPLHRLYEGLIREIL
jgi:hypothetical protein